MALNKRKTYGGTALALLAVLFIGLIMLSSFALRGMRIDLTENKQYTLAPGTLNILKGIKEPITLYFYFSRSAGERAPYLKIYATRVRELLEELSARAKGKIRLQVIDPEPFSEDEDRAGELGLTPMPLGQSGESTYFGLAGTNSTDGKAAIEVFQPDKEEFLEYDIAKLILQLSTPKKATIGLLSALPMNMDFNPQTGRPREPWVVLSQIQQLFTVKTIEESADKIDSDIDVLMVVHPKNVPDKLQFAIEQFIMRGGHALIFVDPRAEMDPAAQGGMNQRDQYAAMMAPRDSSLPKLFKAWGVEFDPKQVTGDVEHALMVSVQQGMPPVRHLGFLGMDATTLNKKDVVTGSINSVNFATAGSFKLAKDSGLKLEPLIETGTQAGQIPTDRFMMMADPASLRDDFKPSGERKIIAGRLTGTIKTAFPNGAPGAETTPAASGGPSADQKAAPAATAGLKQSDKPVNVILVADTDVLSDMLWVRKQSFFGQTMSQAFASNGDFVMNAVDNLAGSSDLISIRGRASFVRPFTVVDEIKRKAEDRFRTKEKELEQELRTTEQKLGELQSSRKDANASLIMTPEQEAEVERFRQEKVRIRKELRDVRHGLDRDIDRLGRNIRIANIVLVPLLLSILAIGAVFWRRRRARSQAR